MAYANTNSPQPDRIPSGAPDPGTAANYGVDGFNFDVSDIVQQDNNVHVKHTESPAYLRQDESVANAPDPFLDDDGTRFRAMVSESIASVLQDSTGPNSNHGGSHDTHYHSLISDDLVAQHENYPQARDDDSDAEAENRYLEAQQKLRHLQNKGHATEEDEIIFHRERKAHDARLKRVRHNKPMPHLDHAETIGDDASDMFVSDTRPERQDDVDPEEDLQDFRPAKRAKSNPETTTSKLKRTKSSNNSEPQAIQSPRKSKVSKKQQKAELAKAREEQNLANLTAPLFGGSVFSNVDNNRARDENPTFQSTRRTEAMRELISSIPEEDQAIARIDRKQMESHLKFFTPNGSCRADGQGGWAMTGMISSLSHYQMLGVAWMRNREVQGLTDKGYGIPGGLIADAMGLGKTVMMIANIVNDSRYHRTRGGGVGPTTTLIVLPNALISQWHAEITKHAKELSVARHHSGHFLVPKGSEESIAAVTFGKFDIILTTYSQVCHEYPRYDPPASHTTAEQKKEWWENHCQATMGALLKYRWRRVVLDEAQAIKNYKSQTSIAVRALQATYHWAITGTPAQNSIQEFYPYFKFLKVPNTGTFRIFKENICTDDEIGRDRLSQLLRTFMLRRTHADELLGAKLLVLPKSKAQTVLLNFTNLERVIYATVHKCFIHRINGFSRAGTLSQNHNHVLCMLLRLRQLVGHPLLIIDTLRDILDEHDYAEIQRVIDLPVKPNSTEAKIISHLRQMMEVRKDELPVMEPFGKNNQLSDRIARPGEASAPLAEMTGTSAANPITIEDLMGSSDKDSSTANEPESGGKFGIRNDFRDFFEHLHKSRPTPQETIKCGFCANVPANPVRAHCDHILCLDCLDDMKTTVQRQKSSGEGSGKLMCPVSSCGRPWSQIKALVSKQSSDTNIYRPQAVVEQPKVKKPNIRQIVQNWVDVDNKMLPSSKTNAVKAALLGFQKSDPGTKTVIYTSFLTMVFILEKLCKLEGMGCELLHGGMDLNQRDQALKRFEKDSDKLVLIATLKCGGVGLNLTMASRVILVDLWWNNSVEDQAFCRTYRRGQDKETTFYRLTVTDTIDDHLVAMQERKEQEIGSVLQGSNKRFTVTELMKLFGQVGTDSKNRPFILVDDMHKSKAKPHGALEDHDGAEQIEDDV